MQKRDAIFFIECRISNERFRLVFFQTGLSFSTGSKVRQEAPDIFVVSHRIRYSDQS